MLRMRVLVSRNDTSDGGSRSVARVRVPPAWGLAVLPWALALRLAPARGRAASSRASRRRLSWGRRWVMVGSKVVFTLSGLGVFRGAARSKAQAGLLEQGQDAVAEVLKIGLEVVEAQLQPIHAGTVQLHKLLHHLLGRAHHFDVAADGPAARWVDADTAFPGVGIAGQAVEALGRGRVLVGHDGVVVGAGLGLGVAADHQRVQQGAHFAALLACA